MLRKSYVCWLFLACLFLSIKANAQDNHYAWTQFGSHNSILNNASLSLFEDESAVIINPATLSLAKQSSFNFNANAFGFTNSRFTNAIGDGFTLKSSQIAILPSTASGVIKPKSEEKTWVLGYALFTSNEDDLNFSNIVEKNLNIIDDTESPGDEYYRAQNNIINHIDELSFVAGIGWDLGTNSSLGVSQSFSYRNQNYTEVFSSYVSADPPNMSGFDHTGANYTYITRLYNVMTYTKVGFTTKIKDWSLGLVITSPTWNIFGTGSIIADFSLINYRASDDLNTPRKNYVGSGEYDKLRSVYKYPFNIAFGISRAFGKVRMYGSLFWHTQLNPYSILDPGDAPFIQPPSEASNALTSQLLSSYGENREIFNGSIAADWTVKPDYHLFFSFRTDFYYGVTDPDQNGFDLAFKYWDYYHFTFGSQRTIGKSDWVIGLRYSYGKRNDYPQPISLNDPTQGDYLNDNSATGSVITNGIQLMLSYTINFGDFGLDQ